MGKKLELRHFFITISFNSKRILASTLVSFLSMFFVNAQTLEIQFPKNNHSLNSDSIHIQWSNIANTHSIELNIAEDILFTVNNHTLYIHEKSDTTIKNLSNCKNYFLRIRGLSPSVTPFTNPITFNTFTPRCINGLQLWLNPDSTVANNKYVTQLNDLSGNNLHATQTNPSFQAKILRDSSLYSNYNNFLHFDGQDDFYNLNYPIPIGSFYSLFNFNSLSNFSGYRTLFTAQGLTPKSIIMMGSIGTTNYYIDGTYNFLSSSEIEVNGVNTADMAPINRIKYCGGSSSSTYTFNNFFLGKYPGDLTSFWSGKVGDIIIYNSPLNINQKKQIGDYYQYKYAPPVYLGQDRTVCSFPITISAKKDYFISYQWNDFSTNDSLVISSPGKYFLTCTNAFGNVSSDTIYISQDNSNYLVNISITDTTICSGETLNFVAGPPHLSYTWSTNSNDNSISINTPGKYYVDVINCNNIKSSDTVIVNVSQKPIFNLGNDTLLCFYNNISINPNLTSPTSYSYYWSDGSNNSTIIPSHTGKYWVKVVNSFFCSSTDTIAIIIDSTLYKTSLGPDISLCAGNSISLQQGLQPNLTYTWNTNENTSAITVTNTGQYSVIITNTNNCVAKDTINVTILGQAPTAAFTNTNACKNNALTFTDNSSPPSGNSLANWYWNFGDVNTLADTSHLQNPFYTYADTGNYIITLNVETNVGCKQSITKTIHVAPTPSVNFNNSITCQNDTTVFTNISSSPNYNPITYQWNFGDLSSGINNNSSSINPKHLFSTQGNFPVKLIATNNVGCKDSLTKTINVKSQVKASFIYSPACKGTPTLFQDNSIVPAPNNQNIRLWSFGTTTLSGTSVSRTFTNTGVYPVTLTVNGLNGCNSSISKLITVFLPPTASFTVPNICLKDTVTITNLSNAQSGIISNYNWKLNQLPFSSVQSPTLSPTSSANYTMQLAVTNSFGCKDSITKTISVLALPNVDFTSDPPTFYFTNSAITFSPTINNGDFYQWNIDGAIYTTPTITLTFNSIGSHTNTLFMTDQQGCSNTKTKTFTISDYLLDLAILDIRTQKDNNNFITVEADLANFGTAPVYNFEITYDVTDAASNKENWSGTLNPSSFKTYTFTSKTLYKKQNDSYITCVTINKVNSTQDDNTNNNQLCVNSDLNSIAVGNPYPNPTNTDVKIPVTLTRDTDITIELYDALGQVIYTEYTIKGGQGLNLISIPTTNLNQSVYTLKVLVGDKIFTKKILKSVQ